MTFMDWKVGQFKMNIVSLLDRSLGGKSRQGQIVVNVSNVDVVALVSERSLFVPTAQAVENIG